MAQSFQSLHAINQPPRASTGQSASEPTALTGSASGRSGNCRPERKFLAVKHVDERLAVAIRFFRDAAGKRRFTRCGREYLLAGAPSVFVRKSGHEQNKAPHSSPRNATR